MLDKIKEVHEIIDLAEKAFRRPTKDGAINLGKKLGRLSESDFKFLSRVYDVGSQYAVQQDNVKEHWERQESINDMPFIELQKIMLTAMTVDQMLEVKLVRGLAILEKGGILEKTGCK